MKSTSSHLHFRPQTSPGHWSAWLEAAFVLMFIVNIPFNIYVIQPGTGPNPAYYVSFILFMLGCGIAGGVVGLIAMIRQHEHSFLVWLSTLLSLFALLLFLNESVQGIRSMLGP